MDRFSVTLGDDRRKELPTTRSVLRSVPMVEDIVEKLDGRETESSVPMDEESVEKLDGRELENPFSNKVLISVDGRYW